MDRIEGDKVLLNGGVRYLPKTDGRRNDLFERFFVTFSPTFEETLATIPNPPAKRGREAGTRLWQESWGPQNYEREHQRSKKLRAYGIEMLTQCNHEITWRDGGESFTFREAAAPGKGGDEALKQYVAAQRSLGWRSGLYTNYTDFAPVNAYWDVDRVMRRSDGNLVTAWPRCYSPKALFAVEMDRKLAPLIQKKFGTNAAYTDVHTSVAPWDRVGLRRPRAGGGDLRRDVLCLRRAAPARPGRLRRPLLVRGESPVALRRPLRRQLRAGLFRACGSGSIPTCRTSIC